MLEERDRPLRSGILGSPLQQGLLTWLLLLACLWGTARLLSVAGNFASLLVAAALVAFLLNYPTRQLQRMLPRPWAAGLTYLVAAIAAAAIALIVVPAVLDQGRQLANNLPAIVEAARGRLDAFQAWSATYNLPVDVGLLEQQLLAQARAPAQAIAARGLGLVADTLVLAVDGILVLVISFYLLVDGGRLWQGLVRVLAPSVRDRLADSLQRNLQQFVSGQILLGLFMAAGLTPLFWWLQVPFFLLFATFIGALEVLPFVGATLGIATVTLLVAVLNAGLALKVLAVSVALQQVKDNLVAPRVFGRLTGLSPAIVLPALLLGADLGGVLGVILAIPLLGVGRSVVEIVADPSLPPQTGSFFANPLREPPAIAEGAPEGDRPPG